MKLLIFSMQKPGFSLLARRLLPPEIQAIFGTLFTWGLTAAGSALVFLMSGTQRKFLDSSLGFAAGVMLAASYWSLLAPAIEMAESSGMYGESGEYAFAPVAPADQLMHYFKIGSTELMIGNSAICLQKQNKKGLLAAVMMDLEQILDNKPIRPPMISTLAMR
ncbi:hypothetical protein OUZ56_033890 [Daphnia magna]|uniref:Zinc transporter ZIP11 n=1 Tax=Daphnia magna TaxID=35525 RepID=A0ABQ9ZYD1_9CRUS|nr:hypothetical protein OUZ56_033890 [Daphnia magna]